MTARSTCIQLAVGGLLLAGIGTRAAVAQGPGVSAGIGVYRTSSTYSAYGDPGTGAELMGQWTFSSGMVLGLGARVISYFRGGRYSAFLDGRYAPPPTATHRFGRSSEFERAPTPTTPKAIPWSVWKGDR
jgi:hypothetical protein